MNGSCWQWAFVQLSFKPHFLFEVWLAEANVSAYISYSRSVVRDFCLLSIIICKVTYDGYAQWRFIEADVLLACIVVLSMWTTFSNPQADQKARLWTWAQEYAQHDEIFWVAMHIDNICFIPYLADIPGGGQELRMQVWWAVQAMGHHTRRNPLHVPFTSLTRLHVPYTSVWEKSSFPYP